MPEYTENYGLTLPLKTENYDLDHMTDSMKIIDTELKRVDDKAQEVEQDLTQHKLDYVEFSEDIQNRIDPIEEQVGEIKDDFESLKNDYATYKDSTTLKVAKVEKELNDYKATMQQVNINQEPKQKVNGYGIIPLPQNAANGQVSAVVKGMTLKNELNYNRDTWAEWNLTGLNKVEGGALVIKRTASASSAILNNTKFKPNTKYGFLTLVISTAGTTASKISCYNDAFADNSRDDAPLDLFFSEVGNRKLVLTSKQTIDNNRLFIRTNANDVEVKIKDLRVFELPTGSEIENDFNTMTADQLAQKYPYVQGDSPKSTVSAMRIKSVSADETETSTAYVVAKDEEGKVAELRSVPNGTKDEISIGQNGTKKTQKNSSPVTINGSSGFSSAWFASSSIEYRCAIPNWAANNNAKQEDIDSGLGISDDGNFPVYATSGKGRGIYFKNNALWVMVEKAKIEAMPSGGTFEGFKEYLNTHPITLIYQLAEPIITPIQTSGSLVSYPSGTVYIEPFVADAGIYADKMEVLYSDLPIKALEKLSKIDFMTGVETELDITAAVIAEDELSFTHPGLTSGDIVFFVYEYDRESTVGETEIEYYDSRYTIKDSVTDKFYKWNVTVADGVPSIELVEV